MSVVVECRDVIHHVEIMLVELGQVGTGIGAGLAPDRHSGETEDQGDDRFFHWRFFPVVEGDSNLDSSLTPKQCRNTESFLSPLRGCGLPSRLFPRLAPWAVFLRCFAAL